MSQETIDGNKEVRDVKPRDPADMEELKKEFKALEQSLKTLEAKADAQEKRIKTLEHKVGGGQKRWSMH